MSIKLGRYNIHQLKSIVPTGVVRFVVVVVDLVVVAVVEHLS